MWYVIQVMTGKEEEIEKKIKKNVDANCFERCFYLKRERVWRRGGKCIIHIETMFPGYVFIDTEVPQKLYVGLKEIPEFTKMLKTEKDMFQSVLPEEEEFLRNLVNGDSQFIVRLSQVEVDEEKNIVAVTGPLEHYEKRIVKKRLRMRYVVIEVALLGKMREVLIGIKVKENENENENRQ